MVCFETCCIDMLHLLYSLTVDIHGYNTFIHLLCTVLCLLKLFLGPNGLGLNVNFSQKDANDKFKVSIKIYTAMITYTLTGFDAVIFCLGGRHNDARAHGLRQKCQLLSNFQSTAVTTFLNVETI